MEKVKGVKVGGWVSPNFVGHPNTHPGVFCAKSAQGIDNTGDMKFAVAKECVTA